MKSITFVVSKGGVGKSIITANVGAALAQKGEKVILIEGDPNQPLQKILGIDLPQSSSKLDEIIEKNASIENAVHSTGRENLFLIPSGVSLQSYFDVDAVAFAEKLSRLDTSFMFIDVPFPLGKAAFLSLGVSEYFIPILTEDEFVLCVESAIDTIRLGKYLLRSVPLGFIMNRIKTPSKFTEDFVEDLEGLLEIPCLAQIEEDPGVWKSYGEVGSAVRSSGKAFLAYDKNRGSGFARCIDGLAGFLMGNLPEPEKDNVVQLLREVTRPAKA